MAERFPVCWQDTRLIFGPLNNVYQQLTQYNNVVELWNNIPEQEVVWIGQPGASGLIFQSRTSLPYGVSCYTVEVERDIIGYPHNIRLVE